MAERRMFAKTIIDSDAFLEMPATSQCLYFHLAMRADDEGFINNPKTIMRSCGFKEDDMNILITRQFIIPFDSGVVVIRHWRIHNYIQKDRFKPTSCVDEKALLSLDKTNGYKMDTDCIQNGYSLDTQVRLGKVRLGKVNKDNMSELDKPTSNPKPPYQEIIDYLNTKVGTRYRVGEETKRLINARYKTGFTLEDFKTVIDNMCSEWLEDSKMCKYLRPQTLFSPKFDSYLNRVVENVDTENVFKYEVPKEQPALTDERRQELERRRNNGN